MEKMLNFYTVRNVKRTNTNEALVMLEDLVFSNRNIIFTAEEAEWVGKELLKNAKLAKKINRKERKNA